METPIAIAREAPNSVSPLTVSNAAKASSPGEKSSRGPLFSLATRFILAAFILAASAYGAFRPLDDWLQGARFALLSRPPTGKVVFLDIDAGSLQTVGVWPWPRTIHAAIVDRLSEMGAKSMAFDIDFSSDSTPENDAAFAAALRRAGGFASLGAFEQSAGSRAGMIVNTPITALAEASDLVSVDVPLDEGNIVRDYPASRLVGGRRISSLGRQLAKPDQSNIDAREGLFGINFAIDLDAIDRISAADLLAGKIAIDRVQGRNVVIGASAQELRDFFVTPRFGMIPGGLVHALAAETLSQGVAMHDAQWQLVAGIIAALALLAALLGHRLINARWLFGALAFAAVVELSALWLQREDALRITSAPVHIALLAFILVGLLSDLRLRRKLHAQAAREREFIRAMLQQVISDDFDGVVIIDEAGTILAHSRLALDFLEVNHSALGAPALPPALAKLVSNCFALESTKRSPSPSIGQLSILADGKGLRCLDYVVTMSSINDESSRRVVCLTFRDVTERQAEQERLKYLANHDPSTGAWLRHALIRNMETRLSSAAHSESMTLILIELRQFTAITNSHGDAVGERLLQSVLARIRTEGHEMIARIGDANFAVAVTNLPGRLAVLHFCRSLIEQLVEPYVIGDRKITIGVDLGVAMSSVSSLNASALMAQARIAQAAAHTGLVNCYEVFSPSMEEEFVEREWIATALRQALTKNQFTLAYQPQIDLITGECLGAEALIRWHHPERGFISPAKFITIAEESGLIVEIGRWAMRSACKEAASWPNQLGVAVNVSPLQFESRELLSDVRAALEVSGLRPSSLTIEITESAFVSGEGETATLLDTLRARGIAIALDDFGTGYSSLSYLDRLPFDKIKIDQSFVKRIIDDPGAAAIVQSVLQLAEKLGKTVVAEGIETAAQAQLLKKLGCQIVQGYYFARPMTAADFRKKYVGQSQIVERESNPLRPAVVAQ